MTLIGVTPWRPMTHSQAKYDPFEPCARLTDYFFLPLNYQNWSWTRPEGNFAMRFMP